MRPAPVLTAELQARAMDEIVRPTARALAAAGTPFSGVLYAGLMLTADGPKLIEYNVRFGDPECEAIMPLIDGDFAELLHAVATGRLAEIEPPRLSPTACDDRHRRRARLSRHARRAAAPSARSKRPSRSKASPSSTPAPRSATQGLVAKGGRVLAVTAVADTFANARARAYRAVDQIDFADGFHRRDIGWRELEREKRMNAFWAYFWPLFAAGLVIGLIAGLIGLRRRKRAPHRRLSPPACSPASPRRSGTARSARADRFAAQVERTSRAPLDALRNADDQPRICIAVRSAARSMLSGPADDFQRSELVAHHERSSRASASPAGPAKAAACRCSSKAPARRSLGFLFGLLLAYLIELRRRYNAQWNW